MHSFFVFVQYYYYLFLDTIDFEMNNGTNFVTIPRCCVPRYHTQKQPMDNQLLISNSARSVFFMHLAIASRKKLLGRPQFKNWYQTGTRKKMNSNCDSIPASHGTKRVTGLPLESLFTKTHSEQQQQQVLIQD
mmetsp:Transcript_7394/g.21536  ORF Transcript_7394/g.21536 Transcript_7394/m.21536 type:complete len:133 (-) Transcript_7394:879-1277(-)